MESFPFFGEQPINKKVETSGEAIVFSTIGNPENKLEEAGIRRFCTIHSCEEAGCADRWSYTTFKGNPTVEQGCTAYQEAKEDHNKVILVFTRCLRRDTNSVVEYCWMQRGDELIQCAPVAELIYDEKSFSQYAELAEYFVKSNNLDSRDISAYQHIEGLMRHMCIEAKRMPSDTSDSDRRLAFFDGINTKPDTAVIAQFLLGIDASSEAETLGLPKTQTIQKLAKSQMACYLLGSELRMKLPDVKTVVTVHESAQMAAFILARSTSSVLEMFFVDSETDMKEYTEVQKSPFVIISRDPISVDDRSAMFAGEIPLTARFISLY